MAKQLPSVSIIIPTRNRWHDLAECLESLKKQSYPQDKIEVIVVDNGSTDGTAQKLKNLYHLRGGGIPLSGRDTSEVKKEANSCTLTIRLITSRTNLGFAPALNVGAKKAQGKYLLVTNDDVTFNKNYLEQMVTLLEKNPKIGVAHGKMFFKNTNQVATPGFKLTPFLGYHPQPYKDLDTTQECDVATGGNMCIRKKLFDLLGGFDEGFFFCGEDYDFCFQAKRLGFKIFYHPKAVCWHGFLQSGKPPGINQDSLFAHYRGKYRYMLKNASLAQLFVFFPIQIVFAPFYSYFNFGHKTFIPIVRALIWNLSHFQEIFKSRFKKRTS